MQGVSQLPENWLASQEGLCCLKQYVYIYVNVNYLIYTVFARVIATPVYFAHPNFLRMILDLFLLHVFHAPSYCSFTSNLTTCFKKKILNPKYCTSTLMLVLENKGLLLFGSL
jgi:hypothetical protein